MAQKVAFKITAASKSPPRKRAALGRFVHVRAPAAGARSACDAAAAEVEAEAYYFESTFLHSPPEVKRMV